MALTIDGLVTGIDTQGAIETLLAVQKKRIDLLQARKATINAEQATFSGFEARLATLRTNAIALARTTGNPLSAKVATSSNTDIAEAAASEDAAAAVYALRVEQTAKAHQIASQGFASATSLITTGNVLVQVGNGQQISVAINNTNNTLQGLASAINAAVPGVSASIIHDGSSTTPYRLLLSSEETGTAQAITITNQLAPSGANETQPLFDASVINGPQLGAGFTGTSTVSSNSGLQNYVGTDDDVYTFTVTQGGTVGVTNGITLSYQDGDGQNSGTITVNAADVDQFKSVAQGLGVKFGTGTLVTGNTFSVAVFAHQPPVQQATDAAVVFGSGAGQLRVTSSSNQFDEVIPGVTLNVLSAKPDETLTLTVKNDVDAAEEAIADFVTSYNDAIKFINEQTSYNPETQKAGALQGNLSARTLRDAVERVMLGTVSGLNTKSQRITALGISVNNDGQLSINSARLRSVLEGNVNGVTIDDVRRLFAIDGQTNHAGIEFLTGSAATKSSVLDENGNLVPYKVDISAAAEQARIQAATALGASTTINNTNNQLVVSINGVTSQTLTLASGTYTRDQLAAHLQQLVNSDTAFTGNVVSVSLNANQLVMQTEGYGSDTTVSTVSGTALATLGFSAGQNDRGADVVGSFIVGNVSEPAIGTGRILRGQERQENETGDRSTIDLQVLVTLSPAQIVSGHEAEITVTRGLASQLDLAIADIFDERLKEVNDGLDRRVADLDDQIERMNTLFENRQQQLVEEFTRMERAVGELQNAGNTLTAQLGNLTSFRR